MNELQIFSRNEFLEEIRTNRKKIESGDVEMLQLDAYRDMQTIISVWETGDSSVLFHRIETYKEEIISYVYHKFGIGRHEAEELWSAARFHSFERNTVKRTGRRYIQRISKSDNKEYYI